MWRVSLNASTKYRHIASRKIGDNGRTTAGRPEAQTENIMSSPPVVGGVSTCRLYYLTVMKSQSQSLILTERLDLRPQLSFHKLIFFQL